MKDLTEIASISGKGGLFRIIKPGRVGVILESMDNKKIKIATNPNHKVSILADISIYTTTEEGSRPLGDILRKIHQEFGDDPGIDGKSTPEEFISFIEYIIPEYDPSRVYPSDVRKLVSWYKILLQEAPEFFIAEKEKKKEKAVPTEKAGETGETTIKSKKETDAKTGDSGEPKPGPNLKTAAKKKDVKKGTPKKKS